MASFSATHPHAYHVLPLHAAKEVWRTGALLGKGDLGKNGATRGTTKDVDIALGFGNLVHLYLPRGQTEFYQLPILHTQLKNGYPPPFPHLVVKVPTSSLNDESCSICVWNIAVSRPRVDGYCGAGMWDRRTSPDKIAKAWRMFKKANPTTRRARGFWKDGILVPILRGRQIQENLALLGRSKGPPELLLDSPFALKPPASMHVFSKWDRQTLGLLGEQPQKIPIRVENFEGYSNEDRVDNSVRTRIDEYFKKAEAALPTLDFDALRR